MMLGLSLHAFTVLHVVISLVGIVTGLIVLFGLFKSQSMPGMTAIFLITTILTNVTGFMFPFEKLLPSHIIAILSLILLAMACIALYSMKLSGAWRSNLCDHCDRLALSQRLRAGDPELPEDRSAACAGAKRAAERAALCRRPGRRVGALYLCVHQSGAPLPSGVNR